MTAPAQRLDQALPPSVVLGGSGKLLRYRQFPVFSWRWLLGRSRWALLLVGLWGGFNGLALGLLAHSAASGLAVAGWQWLAFGLMVTVGPGLATLARHNLAPGKRQTVLIVAAVLAGIVISAIIDRIASAHVEAISKQIPIVAQAAGMQPEGGTAAILTVLNVLVLLVVYALLGGGWSLRAWFGERQRFEAVRQHEAMRRLQLEKQQSQLRLSALQARIEPHFLFNTLASLRALIDSDPAAAAAMLDATTAYLRASIPKMRADGELQPTLGRQLDLCARYLELMGLRLGGRLSHAVTADPALRELSCPPLVVMTLVENAVQHGIETKPGPGRIEVEATRRGDVLRVEVRDNGAGLTADALGGGTGLANVRQQLATQFGEKAGLELSSRSGWTRAIIHYPVATESVA